MGVPTQLTARRGARRGMALPAALFALVAVMVLALGVVGLADARLRAVKDREAGTRAVLLAQEGIAHGLTILKDSLRGHSMTRLMRGSDGLTGTTATRVDDGRLTGYTLSTAIDIPVAGRTTSRGTYDVQLIDDPQDPTAAEATDGNLRMILRCTARTPDGGRATIDAMIAGRPNYGVVVDGPLAFQGSNLQVRGNCGSVHANGSVTGPGGSGPQIAGLTTSGVVTGSYRDTLGTSFTPGTAQPQVTVPALDLTELCSRSTYLLRNDGYFVDRASGFESNASPRWGWRRSGAAPPYTWTADVGVSSGSVQITAGTYCIQGNAVVGGSQGSAAAPLRVSIIGTHSISVAGNPFIAAASSDSVLLAAAGDVQVAGNSSVPTATNYDGLIYANAQCLITGSVRVNASVVCRNQLQPVSATEYRATTEIGGSAIVTHTCNGWLSGTPIIKAWWQPAS